MPQRSAALQLVEDVTPRSLTSRTGQQSVSSLVRERLLAGDELSNRDIQIEYGISNDHCVSDAATRLAREGHSVVKEKRSEISENGRPIQKVFWHVEPRGKTKPHPKKSVSKKHSPDGSVSQQVRQRLLDGDALTARQTVEEFGVSRSLLGVVLAQMRQEGFVVDKEKVEGGQESRFRLTEHPTDSSVSAPKKKPRSKKAIYADLVRRFEAGDRINAHTVIEDYGVESMRFLATFLAVQRKKGWIFTRSSSKTKDGWRTIYRLKWAKPKKKPPAWVEDTSTDIDPGTSVDATTVVDPGDPQEIEFAQALDQFEGSLTLYPQLGTYFRLTLLAEGDPAHCPHCNGELGTPIIYGMRNGTRSLMLQERDNVT